MGVPMVVGAAVRQMLAITQAKFGASSDFTCMAKVVEEWAGVEIRSKNEVAVENCDCRIAESKAEVPLKSARLNGGRHTAAAAPALVKYRMYIGGQWVDAASGEFFESDNPYTGSRGR